MEQLQTLILGSGPAGYTAAIYAGRSGLSPVIYEGLQPGGQLTQTTEVDNFPGYPEGVDGNQLMADLRNQALRFGTEIRNKHCVKADLSQRPFTLTFDDNSQVQTQTLIIATGASAKYLGLPDEEKYRGIGVSACATCDGFFYKGKEVIVVGAGDTAAEEAIYLANICSKVTMLVRKDHFRASKAMVHRLEKISNIEVKFNHELIGIKGENGLVERAVVINNQSQQTSEIPVHGIFITIGHKPNTEIFQGQIDLDENGYIITEGKSSKTNLPGVFAAGDVQDSSYRQAITAAGSGCMAAIDAERYLADLR